MKERDIYFWAQWPQLKWSKYDLLVIDGELTFHPEEYASSKGGFEIALEFSDGSEVIARGKTIEEARERLDEFFV